MRVLIIKGSSLYDGTRLFADHAEQAFRTAGHATEVLDLQGVDAVRTLADHAPGCETDLVFSICILGEYRDGDGRTLAEAYRAPHVLWHVDYLLGQTARLAGTARPTSILTIDPTQADAVRATFGPEYFHKLGFLPHAAVGEAAPDEASAADFAANRPIPLLWSGSFQKPDTSWPLVPEPMRKPLRDALDLALSVDWIPPHEAVVKVLEDLGLDMTDPQHRGAVRMAAFVDDVVRKTRRLDFLKAVAKTRIPIHICGAGWEPQLYRFKNATYHGAVEMTRMIELMRQSRIVLNTNVNFGAGSHERPFSASLAGAATFTDSSRFYEQVFAPGEIATYRWTDLAAGMDHLSALANDPQRCLEMGLAAKRRTLAGHTWDHRVAPILQAAGLAQPA